jgi:hypothetical protein
MTGGIKRGDRLASIMTHLCPTAMDYPTDSDGLLACPFKPKNTKPHPHGHFMILFYPFLFRPFPSLHHGQHSGKVLLTISADQIHSPAAFPP